MRFIQYPPLQIVLFESGTVLGFCAAKSPIIVETKSMAAGNISSSAIVCGFLRFAILCATLKGARWALAGVDKKFENITHYFFISDNFRIKNSRAFPDK